MKQISVINAIQVPEGWEEKAISIRNEYVSYFQSKAGFVSSTFYKSINPDNAYNYVNIVVWDSRESFDLVVNEGFSNKEGLNVDQMKVLGKGFPEPIKVSPGQFEIIEQN